MHAETAGLGDTTGYLGACGKCRVVFEWGHWGDSGFVMTLIFSQLHVDSRVVGIERQDNAKRVMLIGSMVLYVLDFLWKVDIRRPEDDKLLRNHSELPNLGLILALFLRFAEDHGEMCRLNEDGWKYHVVEKADNYGIDIKGAKGIGAIVEAIRNESERANEPRDDESRLKSFFNGLSHWMACYKRDVLSGLITLESLNEGTRRCWLSYDFYVEVRNQFSLKWHQR